MNNSTKKAAHKFNIIDVIIILGIIAAVVFGIKILNGEFLENKIINVNYCIKIDGVTEDALYEYAGGEVLYSTDKNIPIGVIDAVRYENMSVTSFSPMTKRYVTSEIPEIFTIYLDMTAGCVYKNGCYYTENIKISANTKTDINVPFLFDNAEIISVTVPEDLEVKWDGQKEKV